MATLKSKHKSFIVIKLACYDSSTEIQQDFEEEYGFKPALNQISYYNPENIQSSNLAQKWRDLYSETRKRFNEEISSIPIANQAYRLKKLQRNMQKLEEMRNYKAANETIEQAAKEVGGAFTNEKKLDHSGSIGGVLVSPKQQDPEEWAQDVVKYQQKVRELTGADNNGG